MKELTVHGPKIRGSMRTPVDCFKRKKFQKISKTRLAGGGVTVRVRSGKFWPFLALNKNAREKARTVKILCITEGQ